MCRDVGALRGYDVSLGAVKRAYSDVEQMIVVGEAAVEVQRSKVGCGLNGDMGRSWRGFLTTQVLSLPCTLIKSTYNRT